MQKFRFVTFFLIIAGLLANAQCISVTETEMIKPKGITPSYYPRFSPAGDYLLVSSADYKGLREYNFSTKTLVAITEDAGAGYNTQISADGKTILYGKTEFVNNLRHNSLVQIEKSTRVKKQITVPARDAVTYRFAQNKPTYVKNRKMVRGNATTAEIKPIITIEDRKMVIYTSAERKELTPNGLDASYFWPSISPDGKNIVYTIAGKGTFTCLLNGSKVISLGKLGAPVWLNNNWIIGMDDKDDGEKLIASDLIAATIDGKIRRRISTPSGKMAMYPAASADGKRIAFNTEKGELYVLRIEIK